MSLVRLLVGLLAGLLLAGSLALTVLRTVDSAARLPAMATAFASYAVVGFVLALLLVLVVLRGASGSRPWLLGEGALALAGLVLHAVWLAPAYVGAAPGRRADLTVMTANLQYGLADATTLVRAARAQGVDVVVLEEVTAPAAARLDAAGLSRLLPYVSGDADRGANGTVVYSAYPLRGARSLPISHGALVVGVAAPDPFVLIAAHPSQPLLSVREWHDDLRELRRAAAAEVARGPVVVAGDLNSTLEHRALRDVLGVGLSDAARQARSGWQPTWPETFPRSVTDSRDPGTDSGTWVRPLIAIDHVLVSREYAAVRTRTLVVPGSDHRALVAELDRR